VPEWNVPEGGERRKEEESVTENIDKQWWKVRCAGHRAVKVYAQSKLGACAEAAKKWKVPWTSIARECVIERTENG